MKRDGRYRFSLQFGAETESQVRAGELLEKLGNKKSAVVVAALDAYLETHPELCTPALTIRINEENAMRREKLESLILGIVKEQIAHISIATGNNAPASDALPETLEDDIAQMLGNLVLFN